MLVIYENMDKCPLLVQIKDCDEQRGSGAFLKRDTILSFESAVKASLVASSNTAIHALARVFGRRLG